VLEINSYDPDADLFDFCAIYVAPREHACHFRSAPCFQRTIECLTPRSKGR
jgi:phosphoribosyl-AMP cyclohydrolase